MREIRALREGDWAEAARIQAEAYPGVGIATAEEIERSQQNMIAVQERPNVTFYGLFEADKLLGIMRWHDFQMRLLSTGTLAGGVGGVAVDLLYKKEKVARDMIDFYLRHYREQGACMAALYPFRPDFYKRMGFGLGAKLNQYEIDAKALPYGRSKSHLSPLTETDAPALYECHQRYWQRTNGLFERTLPEWEANFKRKGWHFLGYQQEDILLGYLIYSFQKGEVGHFLDNDLVVHEWVYETPAAFLELSTFLHSQADQFGRILYTTYDEDFHMTLSDPRNRSGRLLSPPAHVSNVQGVGIMYRVIDVPRLFAVLAEHDFGGQSCQLQLVVQDSFFPENAGSTVVWFENGRCHLPQTNDCDVTIEMDISEFSSMVTGAVTLERLVSYGLAQISDVAYLPIINRLFWTAQKPICLSSF
jgi:predicted acetyltransferase